MEDRVEDWWRKLAIEYRRIRRTGVPSRREQEWLMDAQIFLTQELPEVPVNA